MQGRPGRVGTERAGGPARMGAGRVGRAQALEHDLSSVRLCKGERGVFPFSFLHKLNFPNHF